MKIKLTLIFLAFLSFSCKNRVSQVAPPYTPFWKPLDIAEFVEQRAKWKSLDIQNYTFTYRCDDYMGELNSLEKDIHCKGFVVVNNGVGSVTFDNSKEYFITPDKNNPREKKMYISSMEDFFDNILEDYLRLKRLKDEGKIDYLEAGGVWYDREYFFLREMSYSKFPFSSSYGHKPVSFQIEDFKVTE